MKLPAVATNRVGGKSAAPLAAMPLVKWIVAVRDAVDASIGGNK